MFALLDRRLYTVTYGVSGSRGGEDSNVWDETTTAIASDPGSHCLSSYSSAKVVGKARLFACSGVRVPLLICAIAAALRTRCGALVFFRIPERDLFLGCKGRLAIELAIWLAADVLDAASASVGASSIASSSS
jgi:hypothetical protein